MSSNFSNKTFSREYAFKFIYKLFLDHFSEQKQEVIADEKKLESLLVEFDESYVIQDEEHEGNELNPSIQSFGKELIKGFLSNEAALGEVVAKYCVKRSYANIEKIDKALLCLGAYEIKYTDTPNKVVINEYINLSKKYGQNESSAFVNGVLDKIGKED